jgi:hypothetical protein
VAWRRVQRPLHLGGLGVLDLHLLGIALHVRWLWLHRVEVDCPWAAMPVQADQQTMAFFRASTSFMLGDGESFKFWVEPWIQGKCVGGLAPDLLSTVASHCRCQRTVATGLRDDV